MQSFAAFTLEFTRLSRSEKLNVNGSSLLLNLLFESDRIFLSHFLRKISIHRGPNSHGEAKSECIN